ncbi:MAG: hypothetical protein F6K14_16615 [Symploca sp. SIO2C1]|nr:hypothetical protein [Symploca sp. SIO2C1]
MGLGLGSLTLDELAVLYSLENLNGLIDFIGDAFGLEIGSDPSITTIADNFTIQGFSYLYVENEDTQSFLHQFELVATISIGETEGDDAAEQELNARISIRFEDGGNNERLYGGKIEIPIADDSSEILIFDLYFQSKKPAGQTSSSNLIVGRLSLTENPDIEQFNLGELVSQISPGLGELFPEELLSGFGLQANMILVIDQPSIAQPGTSRKKRLLFSIGFNAQIKFNDIPLVSDFLPSGLLDSEFAFEFLVALQEYSKKDLETINRLLEELELPLTIKPPVATTNVLPRGASIGGHFDIAGYIQAWLTPLKRTSTSSSKPPASRSADVTSYQVEYLHLSENKAEGRGQKAEGKEESYKLEGYDKPLAGDDITPNSPVVPAATNSKLETEAKKEGGIWGCIQAWLSRLKDGINRLMGGSAKVTPQTKDAQSANVTPTTEASPLVPATTPSTTANEDNLITIADNGVWLMIQKSFGPIFFDKVGLVYKKGEIHLTPQFVIQNCSLLLSLNGLSISSPLTDFQPDFNLQGFGLRVICRGLEIAGAFLVKEGSNYDEYLGTATVGLSSGGGKSALSLSAIGGFADYADQDEFALFIYLAADFPFGGPPFFFVTGVSGGLGYNYDLIVPPLEQVGEFPFVAQAVEGMAPIDPSNTETIITDQLELLDQYIPPLIGAGWGAVGLDFTCFKIIDGFGLVTFLISQSDFELNLIGIGLLQLPTTLGRHEPIAQAEVALQARFAPLDGELMIRGQLTPNSYIFSRNCVLMGGFAYGLWFAGSRAGDFVFSQGGYHPRFQVRDLYPDVPRIGMEWQIDNHAYTTAQIYYALCGHGIMAGGLFAIAYKAGSVWAAFDAGADFLLGWAPYHYDVELRTHVAAGIGSVSVGLGIDIHFWGPDFGCKFKIRILIVPITIKIGDQSSIYPYPIGWGEFQETFLPEEQDVCSITAIDGLRKQIVVEDQEVWVINPQFFEFSTDSLVPSKTAFKGEGEEELTLETNTNFGINSMGVQISQLHTSHRVTIVKDLAGDNEENVEYKFTFEPIPKFASTATWGRPNMAGDRIRPPAVGQDPFIENVFYGFRIVPAEPPIPGKSHVVGIEHLQYETEAVEDRYIWETLQPFFPNSVYNNEEKKRDRIEETVEQNTQRDNILQALVVDLDEVDIINPEEVAKSFIFAPQVK